jgi:hypothetical protein
LYDCLLARPAQPVEPALKSLHGKRA